MTRNCDTYEIGRAAVGDEPEHPPPPAPGLVYSGEDLAWAAYGLTEWLAHTWAPGTDERLDGLAATTDDLAEAVHHLGVLVVVVLLTTIAAIGALVGLMLMTR